jgi:putative Holliday junction resolvase
MTESGQWQNMTIDMSQEFFDIVDVNYLGIDYGSKRVGISIYHGDIRIVLPMKAIIAEDDSAKAEKICEIMKENNINEIAVGYPVNIDGSIGNKAKQVDRFMKIVSNKLPNGTKINHVDEQLTNEQAIGEQRSVYAKQSPAKTKKAELGNC